MISARSPYYRTVQFVSPLTGETCSEYTLNIYVWNGLFASPPTTPVYSITRENYLNSTGSEDVEISKIIKSFINIALTDFTVAASTVSQNETNQVWYKTTVEYVTTDAADDGVEQNPTTSIAFYGYGYGNEGANYQQPIETNNFGIMLNQYVHRTSKNCLFSVPIYRFYSTGVTIESLPNNILTDSFTIAASGDTEDVVKHILINTSYAGSDSMIVVTLTVSLFGIPTNKTVTILLDDDQRFTSTDVYFINKLGAQQTISMRKQRKESISTKRENYERSYFQPADGYHQNVDFNLNGKTSVVLNTGYIPESNNSAVKELMLSDNIWLRYNGETIPVNLKTQNLEYKTRENDFLINYQLEFEYSYYEINNV